MHSSPLAQQQVQACAQAQAQEAERVVEPLRRVAAQRCAGAADAEVAIADEAGRGQGRRGRRPRPWRSPALHDRVEVVSHRPKRPRRGRPPTTEVPQEGIRMKLSIDHSRKRAGFE